MNHSSLRLGSRQVISFFLVFLAVSTLAMSICAVAPVKAVVLLGTEQQITTNPAAQTDPAISGNNIVYTDDRNGNQDIYFYNITTGEETNLNPGTPNDQYSEDISGNQVVYTNVVLSFGAEIFLYDLSTWLDEPLYSSGYSSSPSIDKNLVTWSNMPSLGSFWDIILANLTERRAITLVHNALSVGRPRVDNGIVVWAELIGEWGQIRSYNCSSGEYRTITTSPAIHGDPDVSGSKIVWASNEAGNFDIYLYDFTTEVTTQLTYNSADQIYPRISGNNVIWEDIRSGTHQIWFLNLDIGLEMPVYPTGHMQFLNAIDGNRIVWTESRYGNLDIFMFTIGGTPTASFSHSPEYPMIGETVTFDASASTPQESIIQYYWDLGDGTTVATTSPITTHSYNHEGLYTVILTVTDALGQTVATQETLAISAIGPLPMASFTYAPAHPLTGEIVTFDASSSTPQTDITEYKWNFGDGQTTATANPVITHTYMLKGTYIITLTVKDSTERESTTTKPLTATEPPRPVGGISTSINNLQVLLTYYLGTAAVAASVTILFQSTKRQRKHETHSTNSN